MFKENIRLLAVIFGWALKYTLQGTNRSHLQKCLGMGYVSSLECFWSHVILLGYRCASTPVICVAYLSAGTNISPSQSTLLSQVASKVSFPAMVNNFIHPNTTNARILMTLTRPADQLQPNTVVLREPLGRNPAPGWNYTTGFGPVFLFQREGDVIPADGHHMVYSVWLRSYWRLIWT